MNIYEFVKQGGKVKTSSGHEVIIRNPDEVSNTDFHIYGEVQMANTHFDCFWNKDGIPHKLPLTHGLNLHPYMPKIIYERLPDEDLKAVNHITQLKHIA